MTIEQYKSLLSLYKKKVAGEFNENEIKDSRLKARIGLDKAIIDEQAIDAINEFINELNAQ